MWIITHKSQSHERATTSLGRDSSCDYVIGSTLVSRNQLEFITQSGDEFLFGPESKTPIVVRVLSRARSVINNQVYKLGKADTNPLELDLTDQDVIDLKFRIDSKTKEEEITTTLRWKPFNVLTYPGPMEINGKVEPSPLPEKLKQLYQKGVDLRITNNSALATHYYTISEQPTKTFRIALSRGVPILNEDWYSLIYSNPEKVNEWLLHIDLTKFTPSQSQYLLPNPARKRLLVNTAVVTFDNDTGKCAKWIHALGGVSVNLHLNKYLKNDSFDDANLYEDIKLEVGSLEFFIMVTNKNDTNFELLRKVLKDNNSDIYKEDTLFNSVKMCSLADIRTISPQSLKRKHVTEPSPSQTNSQTTSTQRKRRKYEKKDKMHFFDLKTQPSIPDVSQQENEEIQSEETANIDKQSINVSEHVPSSHTIKSPEVVEDSDDAQEIEIRPSSTVNNGTPSTLETTQAETKKYKQDYQYSDLTEDSPRSKTISPRNKVDNTLKRNIPDEDDIPRKNPKLKAKVSLVDAIIRTKENATKTTNLEFGIDDSESGDINQNLSNLAIIEEVDIPLRTPPKRTDISKEPTKHTRNFKKFSKNIPLKSKVTRSYVDLDTIQVDNEIRITGGDELAEDVEENLRYEFEGHMQGVKAIKPQATQPSLFVDEDSQPAKSINTNNFRPVAPSSVKQNTTTIINFDDDDDEDDDEDEDDDQPKFGFRRKR